MAQVWNPATTLKDRRDLMPVITPAYPSMCSTFNVSKSTLQKIMEEIRRGLDCSLQMEVCVCVCVCVLAALTLAAAERLHGLATAVRAVRFLH